jgi:hypothetical protein
MRLRKQRSARIFIANFKPVLQRLVLKPVLTHRNNSGRRNYHERTF